MSTRIRRPLPFVSRVSAALLCCAALCFGSGVTVPQASAQVADGTLMSAADTVSSSRPLPLPVDPTRFTSIPEVQHFFPDRTGAGTTGATRGDAFRLGALSRIMVKVSSSASAAQRRRVLQDAHLVAGEVPTVLGKNARLRRLPVTMESLRVEALIPPTEGAIVLRLEPSVTKLPPSLQALTPSQRAESYVMVIGRTITITAPTPRGLFYGTRTLLQSLAAHHAVPVGTVVDWPAKPDRILHVDAGRKYYTQGWFTKQIRRMSYLKLNQLQYHFSENEGFRLYSDTYPEIVDAMHLAKEDMSRLIHYAARYHVEIVPAFDVPGHMEAVLNHFPQYRASNTPEGRRILDYSNPQAVRFIKNLIDEYAELFPSTTWHMGGDEVFDLKSSAQEMGVNFPHLLDYARQHASAGQNATVLDGYTYFLNDINQYLRSKGKTNIRVWNDALYWDGTSEKLDPRVTVTYWSRWFKTWVSVERIRQHGHQVINFNGDYLYYVLAKPGGSFYVKPSPGRIYSWSPGRFPQQQGTTIFSSQEDQQYWPEPSPSWITGAAFSIWSDSPDVMTEQQVSQGIMVRLRAMAAKTWTSQPQASYLRFRLISYLIGDAPAGF